MRDEQQRNIFNDRVVVLTLFPEKMIYNAVMNFKSVCVCAKSGSLLLVNDFEGPSQSVGILLSML